MGGRKARFLVLAAAGSVVASGCSDHDRSPERPQFEWGYPEYSRYDADGRHVGTTLYQQDPECQRRLTFYDCSFIDAQTPDDDRTNPTRASTAMTGGLDSCTAAIQEERPSYCIPADVCNPRRQNPAWAPGQASSDNLAWQLFLAVNWPANAAEPGYPDPSMQPGDLDPSGGGHARTVWLDYPTADQLFGVPPPCEGDALSMSSKISDAFLAKEPPQDAVEPGGGVLVDQSGGVVQFDIRVNRTEWEFIVNQNDYWRTGASLDALKQDLLRDYSVPPGQTPGGFPAATLAGDGVLGDVGSMEIKAAWKPLTPAEAASGTFYTREFAVYDAAAGPDGQCVPRTMGLVGMHIVYMPALFGNPEWVWATFEHRANVPTAGIDQDVTRFSFHDPACTPVRTPEECGAYVPGRDAPQEFRCCPDVPLYEDESDLPDDPVPNQLTRVTNPSVSTILPTDCTGHYVDAIEKFFGADNVWRNYFLVSTQWPLRGASTNFPAYDPGVVANFPCTLRNSTIESFLVGGEPAAMNGCNRNARNPFCRSCNGDCVATAEDAAATCPGGEEVPSRYSDADCMGCHGTYAGQNSSFIFGHRPCCVRDDLRMPNTCGTFLEEDVCRGVSECEWVASDPACSS